MHSTSRYSKQCAHRHDEQRVGQAGQDGRSGDRRGGRNESWHAGCDVERDVKRSVQWFEFRGVRCRLLRWGCEGSSALAEGSSVPQNVSLGASRNVSQDASLGESRNVPQNASLGESRNVPQNASLGAGQDSASCAPVVFLHGFAQSASTWDEVARSVAAKSGAAVYAVDFVGHGQSGKPASTLAYGMDFTCVLLWALLCFVQRENAGKAPVVVGYSMGGRIALASVCRALQTLAVPGKFCAELAASESQSGEISSDTLLESPFFDAGAFPLSALVLESAGLGPCSEEDRMAKARLNEQRACALRQQGIGKFMDAWENLPLFFTQRELPKEVQKRIRAGRVANDAEALARTLEGTGAQHMPSRNACVAALAALVEAGFPVCYIAGQRDGKYSELARALRERLGLIAGAGLIAPACADVCIAPGAGHNVHLEAPEWFSRKLISLMSDFA